MKQYWQYEQEALDILGFSGTNGNADRERAVETVISLMKENEKLRSANERLSIGVHD